MIRCKRLLIEYVFQPPDSWFGTELSAHVLCPLQYYFVTLLAVAAQPCHASLVRPLRLVLSGSKDMSSWKVMAAQASWVSCTIHDHCFDIAGCLFRQARIVQSEMGGYSYVCLRHFFVSIVTNEKKWPLNGYNVNATNIFHTIILSSTAFFVFNKASKHWFHSQRLLQLAVSGNGTSSNENTVLQLVRPFSIV